MLMLLFLYSVYLGSYKIHSLQENTQVGILSLFLRN